MLKTTRLKEDQKHERTKLLWKKLRLYLKTVIHLKANDQYLKQKTAQEGTLKDEYQKEQDIAIKNKMLFKKCWIKR